VNVMEYADEIRNGKRKIADVPKEMRSTVQRMADDVQIHTDQYVKGKPSFSSPGSGRFRPSHNNRNARSA
jgi:hypothetical protein